MTQKYKGLENRKILVVEDVELNQYLARHIMESWGCIVQVAENGEQAVEKIRSGDYELVLMDIQMPVMDGIEATQRIRGMEDAGKAAVPIVALTANARATEFEMYIRAGMNDCMRKPFEESELFRVISKNILPGGEAPPEAAGPSAARPAPAKMYDLAMVEMISGGDASFTMKMLRLFLDTVPATLSDLSRLTKSGDWPGVSKLAHKLKSTIDSMGITELKQEIRVIEANGKSSTDVQGLPGRVENVIVVMNRVMVQVKKDHSL